MASYAPLDTKFQYDAFASSWLLLKTIASGPQTLSIFSALLYVIVTSTPCRLALHRDVHFAASFRCVITCF